MWPELYCLISNLEGKAVIEREEPPIIFYPATREEDNGNTIMVEKLVDDIIRALRRGGVELAWMKEAESAERAGYIATCRAIIRNTIEVGVEEVDRKRIWVAKAEECEKRGSIETARAIYAHAVTVFSTEESVWVKAAQLEKRHGTRELLDALLRKAVTKVPHDEVLWLICAKEKWLGGDAPAAQAILQEACAAIPESEEIWLLRGELEERLNNLNLAKQTYELGLKRYPNCIPLWLSFALLEEKVSGLRKALAVLTMAREKNPRSPQLWFAAVRAEVRHGHRKESEISMSNALLECPTSGLLWAASIEMLPPRLQGNKIRDVWSRMGEEDSHVLAAAAKTFWHDGKVDKARTSFDRAVTLSPDVGDFWALYYKFELEHGTDESQKDVLNRCVAAEPKRGEKWEAMSKAVENWHQPTEVILKEVVDAIEKKSEKLYGRKLFCCDFL